MAEAKEQIAEGELDQAVQVLQQIDADYPETKVADRAREQVRFYRSLANAEAMFPLRQTRDTMITTARAIQQYRDRHRRWPASLETLIPKWIEQTPVDTWGRTLIYKRKASGRGYVLASLGADWKAGGGDDASDLIVEDGNFVTQASLSLP